MGDLSTVPSSIENGVKDSQGGVYDGDLLIKYKGINGDEYHVKEGTKVICDKAFACSFLKTLVLPESIQAIGRSAFEGSVELESINIPGEVTDIPHSAFKGCGNLKALTLPKSIKTVGPLFVTENMDVLSVSSKIEFHKDAFALAEIAVLEVPKNLSDYYEQLKKDLRLDCVIEANRKSVYIPVTDPLEDYRGGNWIDIKFNNLAHNKNQVTDTRLTQNPVLSFDKYADTTGTVTKSAAVGASFPVTINHILKTVGKSDGFLMLQFANMETNIPELNAIGTLKDKALYAINLTKVYEGLSFAKAPKPTIPSMWVSIQFARPDRTETAVFKMEYGKITALGMNDFGIDPEDDILQTETTAINIPAVSTETVPPSEHKSFLSGIIDSIKGLFG